MKKILLFLLILTCLSANAQKPNNTYTAFITTKNALSSALYYIPDSGKTTTSFDIVYLTALTGAVSFDWQVIQN